MGPIGSSETSVSNHFTPRTNPEDWRIKSTLFVISTFSRVEGQLPAQAVLYSVKQLLVSACKELSGREDDRASWHHCADPLRRAEGAWDTGVDKIFVIEIGLKMYENVKLNYYRISFGVWWDLVIMLKEFTGSL